jgi:hypothetical protein
MYLVISDNLTIFPEDIKTKKLKWMSPIEFVAKATSDEGLEVDDGIYVDIDSIDDKAIVDAFKEYIEHGMNIKFYSSNNNGITSDHATVKNKEKTINSIENNYKEFPIGETITYEEYEELDTLNKGSYKVFTVIVTNAGISTYNCIARDEKDAIRLVNNITNGEMKVVNEMPLQSMII